MVDSPLGKIPPIGKLGKIPTIKQISAGKSASFYMGSDDNLIKNCDEINFKLPNLTSDRGRKEGESVLYGATETDNYLSQSERYERSINLLPARIVQDGNEKTYWFASCTSSTGFWVVQFIDDNVTFEVVKPIWNILCPKPIEFNAIDGTATGFTWRQIQGSKTVTLDGVNLNATFRSGFRLTPTIDILSLCLDTGCDDGTSAPIRLEVFPDGRPEYLDTIFIYTTPTSFFDGISYGFYEDNSQKSTLKTSVAYTQKTYLAKNPNILGIDWFLPPSNSEYVVGYAIQENIDGVFTTVQSYDLNDNPKHFGKFDTSYQVITYFDNNGFTYSTVSAPFRFDSPQVKTVGEVTSEDKIIFGDDDYGSQLSYGFYANSHETVPLNVQFINPSNDQFTSQLSYGFYANSHETVPLIIQFINPSNDQFTSQLSYGFYANSHETVNLGGIIIG